MATPTSTPVGFHASRHSRKEGIELGDLAVLVFTDWSLERTLVPGLDNRGEAYIYTLGVIDAARIRFRYSFHRSACLSRRIFGV